MGESLDGWTCEIASLWVGACSVACTYYSMRCMRSFQGLLLLLATMHQLCMQFCGES